MIIVGILLVVLATLIGASGSLLLKKGSGTASFNIMQILRNKYLVLGLLLYGLSTIPFIIGLKFGPLSMLYPFTSLSYIWVSLLSMKYLNEKMNLLKWLGVLFILTGVSLISGG